MKKICKLCGKEFETKSGRKSVCNDDHFTTCVICGKSIKIKYASEIPKTCSTECRMELMRRTCEEKYGSRDPGNLPEFREKSKRTCQKRYGTDNPSKCSEITTKIKQTWKQKYGVENVSQLDSHKKQVSEAWAKKSDNEISEISYSSFSASSIFIQFFLITSIKIFSSFAIKNSSKSNGCNSKKSTFPTGNETWSCKNTPSKLPAQHIAYSGVSSAKYFKDVSALGNS